MAKEKSSQITRRATRSSALAKCSNNVVEETDTSSPHPNDASLSSDLDKEETQQITRRTTRSLPKCPDNVVEETNASSQPPPTLDDLVLGEEGESFSFYDLVSSFPGRQSQIKELVQLLGPLNSPMFLVYVWRHSTGKQKTGRVLGPISRLKDVIVGGQRRGSFIRCSASSEL